MTEYYFKRTAKGAQIFKDDFDHPMYEIQDSTCTCPGCTYHKVRCKHLTWFGNALTDPRFILGSIFEYDPFRQKLVPFDLGDDPLGDWHGRNK
jgi:hypothetical protein